jgi:hypothetical protein
MSNIPEIVIDILVFHLPGGCCLSIEIFPTRLRQATRAIVGYVI